MSQDIRQLEPKALWNKFADLNAVPRPSKKEERVIAFMKDFGKNFIWVLAGIPLPSQENPFQYYVLYKRLF